MANPFKILVKRFVDTCIVPAYVYIGLRKPGPNVLEELERRTAAECADYVLANMAASLQFAKKGELQKFALGKSGNGLLCEFGVWKGESINRIAALVSPRTVFGFDSFEGLREDWAGWEKTRGDFDLKGRMLAQAITGTPGHVNAMAASVGSFLEVFPVAAMLEGDVYVTNDSWLGTSLAIDLRETPTGTRVHLVHGGYRAKNEVYERSSDAWPYFLRSLAKYMLTGAGEPYPKAPKERVMGSDTRPTAMLILRNDGVDWAQLAADGRAKALFQQFVDWVGDLQRRGVYAGVEGLQQSGGRTVRRKGAGLVIDGPFAEGREAVLGVILVRVKDIDEACAIAGESPHVEVGGAMEVRMVAPFPKP